jgi:hypothetical protein
MTETVDEYFAKQSIRGSYSIEALSPLPIAGRRQLMLDDALVEDSWNCQRVVHRPTKHPRNPLISPTTASLGRGMPWTSVLYDSDRKRFQLWGNAHPAAVYAGAEVRPGYRGVYFESEDGIEWSSPTLGQVPLEGNTANNIFFELPGRALDNLAVSRLPAGWDHLGQYVMAYGSSGANLSGGRIDVAFSHDGLHWADHDASPVVAGMWDTHNNLVFDPDRGVFILYQRPTIAAFEPRRIAASESTDLKTWTQPRTILFPDELDPPMFYGMTVDRYEGLFLGFLMVYYRSDSAMRVREIQDWQAVGGEFPKEHQMENQLAWSRDGLRWSRHPSRPVFLETGRKYTDHDWGLLRKGTGIVERGDELYLYYQAADRIKKTPYTDRWGEWSLNLATIRKDGFVSLDSRGQGFILTVPISHPGGRLHINARTGRVGQIKVGVRRGDGIRDGESVDGHTFERSVAFEGDSTDHTMDWIGGPDPEQLRGEVVRLHFWLRDASLYSFWIE